MSSPCRMRAALHTGHHIALMSCHEATMRCPVMTGGRLFSPVTPGLLYSRTWLRCTAEPCAPHPPPLPAYPNNLISCHDMLGVVVSQLCAIGMREAASHPFAYSFLAEFPARLVLAVGEQFIRRSSGRLRVVHGYKGAQEPVHTVALYSWRGRFWPLAPPLTSCLPVLPGTYVRQERRLMTAVVSSPAGSFTYPFL